MAEQTVLIIGASRGIGLGLVREFADRGWRVYGTERSRSDDLHSLADTRENVELLNVDVTNDASVRSAIEHFKDRSLDVVVVNAGITGADHQSVEKASHEDIAHVMMTNAVGPAAMAKKLLPKMKDGARLGMMTSRMGSIADSSGGFELYRMSKTAQNILARGISEQQAKARGICVLSLHPGWVKTDMGGPNATITVEESVNGLCDLLEKERSDEHRFLAYDGSEIPW